MKKLSILVALCITFACNSLEPPPFQIVDFKKNEKIEQGIVKQINIEINEGILLDNFRFYVDKQRIYSDIESPYTATMNTVDFISGKHELMVTCKDSASNSYSESIIFEIIESLNGVGEFWDERDDIIYGIVDINDSWWMAENLRYNSPFQISFVYGDISAYEEKFGRLYNYLFAPSICPAGWHLPTIEEWLNMIESLGGEDLAGGKMKSTEDDWINNEGATNESGFSALPGGYLGGTVSVNLGIHAAFWSSTQYSINDVWTINLFSKNDDVEVRKTSIYNSLSIRCLKD